MNKAGQDDDGKMRETADPSLVEDHRLWADRWGNLLGTELCLLNMGESYVA